MLASTLPPKDFASSHEKRLPETVCSPDQDPGAIFTFCLKLIQSHLSDANNRERNSPGLWGKAHTHMYLLSFNEIKQAIVCVLFVHYVHILMRGRNALSSHL